MLQPFVIVALLAAAYQAGERDRLGQLAANASVPELVESLGSSDRAEQLGAIAAAPASPAAWALLEPLSDLAKSRDRRIASTAARSAARIANALTPQDVYDGEVPVDMLRRRTRLWRGVADSPGRWPDVRVHALEVTTALHRALADPTLPFDLTHVASDREPEVRRAALELLPIPLTTEHIARVGGIVTADVDPAVALAAAQALCIGIALDADPAPLRAALGAAGMAKVRTLVAAPDAAPAAASDAKRCLP